MLGQLGESSIVRTILVATVLLAVQTTVLTEIRPLGVVIDLVVPFAAVAGVLAGPRRGLRVAFLLGLGFDLLIGTALGLKPMTYSIVAFVLALLPWEKVLAFRPITAVVIGAAGGGGAVLEVLLAGLTGRDEAVSLRLTVVFAVVALASAAIALIAVRIMRWSLMAGDRPRL